MRALAIAEGQRFGRLTALGEFVRLPNGRRGVRCRCDCGSLKTVAGFYLVNGESRSCGCLQRDVMRARITHGHAVGQRVPREYTCWAGMKNRCFNRRRPDYADYGGRGITVCAEWRDDFSRFLSDMGPRPDGTSLDRINNDGNYEPGNCRWATAAEQARNRRPRRRANG